MKKLLLPLLILQGFTFTTLAHASVQYLKGHNCEYSKNGNMRLIPTSLISLSRNPHTNGINFFNAIDASGALLVGLSRHEFYHDDLELEYPMNTRDPGYKIFTLEDQRDIRSYGYNGSYVKRAMAIGFTNEMIDKLEFVLWDNSRQRNWNGEVDRDGTYRFKCENISTAKPEFIQSIASNSLRASLVVNPSDGGVTGFIDVTLPFSYGDNFKELDFEDSLTVVYKVKGVWKDKTITKSFALTGMTPQFEIKKFRSRNNINFDKSLTFSEQTPKNVPRYSVETRLIFERKYKSSSRPSLKIEHKIDREDSNP